MMLKKNEIQSHNEVIERIASHLKKKERRKFKMHNSLSNISEVDFESDQDVPYQI